jgi:hypothetical protein
MEKTLSQTARQEVQTPRLQREETSLQLIEKAKKEARK